MNIAATVAPGAETSASMKNDDRLKKFNQLIRDCGKASAAGKDALPTLAQAIVQNVAHGVINVEDKFKGSIERFDKDGRSLGTPKSVSWAVHAYEMYMAAEGAKAVHERSSDSITAQASKLNNMFKLGASTTIDGAEVAQRAFELYNQENGGSVHNKAFRSAYDYYITVAKAQLSAKDDQNKTPLTDDQLKALMKKPDAAVKGLDKVLKGLMDGIEALMDGSRKDGVQDNDELVEVAFNAIRDRYNVIVQENKVAELKANAAKLGIII